MTEQARAYDAKAAAELAAFKPQASLVVANVYQNARFLPSTTQENGAAGVMVNWTLFDGGKARRRSLAQERRGMFAVSQRTDMAAAIALQVRSAWLKRRRLGCGFPSPAPRLFRATRTSALPATAISSSGEPTPRCSTPKTFASRLTTTSTMPTTTPCSADFELHRAIGDL